MAEKLVLELSVDDKGTATIKNFSTQGKQALDDVGQSAQSSSSHLSGLKNSWAIMAAGVASSMYIVTQAANLMNKAWSSAEASANYLEQMQLLDGLARGYKTTATSVTGDITRAGEGMISMSTAASVAMAGLAKGLSPEQLTKLAGAAVTLSDVMGVKVNEAFKTVAEALESGRVKSLKLAVGTIDLKDRYGEAADAMTEAQKQQALYNIIIEKATEISRLQGGQTKSTADKMEAMRVTVQDLNLELGTVFIRAGSAVVGTFQAFSSASMAASSAWWKFIEVAERAAAAVTFGDLAKEHMENSRIAAQNAASDWKEQIRLSEKSTASFAVAIATTAELTKATGAQSAATKEGGKVSEETSAAKKSALEALKAADKSYFQEQEILIKSNAELMKAHYATDYDIAKTTLDSKLSIITQFFEASKIEILKEAEARTAEEKTKVDRATFISNKLIALDADVNKQRLDANANFTSAAVQLEGKWLAQKRDLGQTSTEIAIRELQREADAYSKLAHDKNEVEEWRAAKERQIRAAAANEAIAIYKTLYEDAVSKGSAMADVYLSQAVAYNSKTIANDKDKWEKILGGSDSAWQYMALKSEQFVRDFTGATKKMTTASQDWSAQVVRGTSAVAEGMASVRTQIIAAGVQLDEQAEKERKYTEEKIATYNAMAKLSGYPINLGGTTGSATSGTTGSYTGAGSPIVGTSGYTQTTIGGMTVDQYNSKQNAAAAATASLTAAAALTVAQTVTPPTVAAPTKTPEKVSIPYFLSQNYENWMAVFDGKELNRVGTGWKSNYHPDEATQKTVKPAPYDYTLPTGVSAETVTVPYTLGDTKNLWIAIYNGVEVNRRNVEWLNGKQDLTKPEPFSYIHKLAQGGWITEPVRGIGASGRRYEIAENEAEYVSPKGKMGGGPSIQITIQAGTIVADEMSVDEFAQKIGAKLYKMRTQYGYAV